MTNQNVVGYLIAYQNWYALPVGADFPGAGITSLDENASVGGEEAQLIKRTYQILEVPAGGGNITIGDCKPIGEPSYETLEDAQNELKELGIENPQVGYNVKN